MTDPVLSIEHLRSGYGGIRALDDVSITVPDRGVVAILGANGSGKSTLLRTISGLLRAWSGHITFAGSDVTRWSPDAIARAGIAHVPEARGLFPDMTVEENLRMGCQRLGRGESDAAMIRAEALFPVLAERRRQRASTLSGGQQQMLAIARAVCLRPRLLMLDEMSQGLGPAVVAELAERVEALRLEGTAVLLVEQYAAAALRMAGFVYVLEKGRVAFSGTPAELASGDAVRDAYLGTRASSLRNGSGDRATEEVLIRISPRTRRRYEALARERGTSVGEEVRAALAARLDGNARTKRRSRGR